MSRSEASRVVRGVPAPQRRSALCTETQRTARPVRHGASALSNPARDVRAARCSSPTEVLVC